MKNLLVTAKRFIPILVYMIVYMVWFFVLEKNTTTYRIIHTNFDDKIPFCEYFVIPYFIWFGYVSLSVVIAGFDDIEEYKKGLFFLMSGMTIFLIISTLWPNGHNLRPMIMPHDNLCSRLVEKLYLTDTPTNLWPSIHVYNSIGAHLCLSRCNISKKHPVIKYVSFVIAVSIILSTMFIKQHSLFDVSTAFLMAAFMGFVVYHKDIQANSFKHKPGKGIRFI